jgi:hypothetical protein
MERLGCQMTHLKWNILGRGRSSPYTLLNRITDNRKTMLHCHCSEQKIELYNFIQSKKSSKFIVCALLFIRLIVKMLSLLNLII